MLKKLEIALRKLLVLILSGKKRERKVSAIPKNSVKRILLIRLNRIGDALVTTPLITLLKENLGCSIDILADKKNYFVFEGNEFVDNLFVFKKGLKGFREFVKNDRENRYDVIIDAHDDVSTTVSFLIELSRAPYKLGLAKQNHTIYTTTIPRPDSVKVHVVERIASIAKAFGIEPERNKLNIIYRLKKESEKYADEFIAKNKLGNGYLVGINISAGSDARFWGVNRFTNLINYFKKFNVSTVLLTAEKDYEKAREINSAAEAPIFMSKNFNYFAAMIARLDFLFTPDTSVVHLASAYRIPTFGIYVKFETDDVIWYPYNCAYEAIVTTEPNFSNLEFESVTKKLAPFFSSNYNSGKH